MPATPNGFQLVDGDLEILRFALELRHATIENLAELCGRSYTRTHKRVEKLTERHYLACLTRRPAKHIYALGPEGVAALIEQGYAPQELAGKRIRHGELKEIYILHTLFVSAIHAKLIVLARSTPIKLVDWDEGRSLWDSVPVRDEMGVRVIPVCPDARFALKHTGLPDGKNKFNFFLEADRATMSHNRMKEKVRGFIAYFQQQKHAKKYPWMRFFRVATVTETKARARELAKTFEGMMEPAWRPSYPVLAFEDLALDKLLPPAAAGANPLARIDEPTQEPCTGNETL